jgi:paraquat-inducible protein B
MSEQVEPHELPQAAVVTTRRRRVSGVWIIPLVAAVVAIGLAIQKIVREGPMITIILESAEGVEAGKTFVKYKDVNIGEVTAVRLSDDLREVELSARIDRGVSDAMVEDAKFWIVRPRVSMRGISGLGTILSGNYVGFEPGKSKTRVSRFLGLSMPPTTTSSTPGKAFVLEAEDVASIGIGSPVHYRGLRVGQVVEYDLSKDGKKVEVRVFVDAPNDKFVHPGTRFWNSRGLKVSLGANGMDVQMESLLALIEGGVAFDTPEFEPSTEPAAAETMFKLFREADEAMKQADVEATPYVLYFNESLRGLSVGAPVTLFGLPVGEVKDLGLTFDSEKQSFRPRVHVVFFIERLLALLPSGQADTYRDNHHHDVEEERALFKQLVEQRGMRAQLRSGNLISGQMYVALDLYPDAAPVQVDWTKSVLEMPVLPSTMPEIETRVSSILAKLDQVPYADIADEVRQELASLRRLIDQSSQFLTGVESGVFADARDTVKEVNSAVADLRRMIAAAERLVESTETTLLGPNAPAQQEWREVLQEVARSARAFRVLTDYLERHPEALLRGKPDEERSK